MTSLPFYYTDFHLGLNTRASPYLLQDEECRDTNNVQGTTAGAIVKRGGFVTLAQPGGVFTSLYPYEATSPNYLIGTTGTGIYSVSTGGTVTSLGTTATANQRWEWVQAPRVSGQGPLYGMNGTDAPRQWAGSGALGNWTATDGGSVPNGKYCVFSNNRVFVAGVAANPSSVFVSGPEDPTAWNTAGAAIRIDFDPTDGQAITALGTVGPYVLVAKNRKLFLIIDPGNAAVVPTTRRLSATIGCIAHRSLASDASGTYFLAEDRGVYVTNGSKLTPISDNIQPTIDGIIGSRAQAAGVCFGGHYYLSLPGGSATNDTILDYDVTLNSWWKHVTSSSAAGAVTSFVGSNQFAVWHPSGNAQLYSAKAATVSGTAYVDQCFVAGTYLDNGSTFSWSWFGPWQSPTFYRRRRFPTPYFRKNLRQVRVEGLGQVDLSLGKDFSVGATTLQSNIFVYSPGGEQFGGTGYFAATDGSVFGSGPMVKRARQYSCGVANAFSLVFSGTNSSPATVYAYVMEITDRKDLIVS